MKLSTILKSGLGLIYTTALIAAVYMGVIWLTQFIIKLNLTGAILYWLIGIPIIVGLFQFIASIVAIPAIYLLKGSKWMSWLLVLPTLFFVYSYGSFLWNLASAIGGVLVWLLLISWFLETIWLFVAYLMVAMGSAFETEE